MKTFELKGSVRADLGKKASKAERVSENVLLCFTRKCQQEFIGRAEDVFGTLFIQFTPNTIWPETFLSGMFYNKNLGGWVNQYLHSVLL
jgi:hypothetical protein